MTSAFAAWLAGRANGQIEFAPGVTTPRRFSDPHLEHLATRRTGGLFDFSFMSCTDIRGTSALACVNALQTRRLDALRPGRIAYTLLLREVGSVLSDATVWRLGTDRFWVFTGRRADSLFIAQFGTIFDVEIADRAPAQAVIAVQGDISRRTIEQCFPRIKLTALPYFGFARAMFEGAECWIARLGYSGETGYELMIADAAAASLWQALLDAGRGAGLVECGFDAVDSLRIEAGHILFTRELTSPMTPFELGFARLVDFDRRTFYGAPALRAHHRKEPPRRLVGLLPGRDAKPGLGVPGRLYDGSAVMTSACWSPLLERRIGIGFVGARDAEPGTVVRLGDGARARVARLPYYDPAKVLPRRAC
jgi:aminomethyltransferase